ncbi:hypothetical protein K450DRAFT_227890 [Umbelopsis ramanniana AG]|uniref:DIS3-like exonuclease 2 n=1 Tax=Umbelopsis ramanniana AG TaxID=1314678 RepID=A0AAD5EEY4_UMBRA|nr:uncharacterized protein K450DRAFT_227890 [Umbelopsis ramanniana AG]KAI8582204.1 hypothetical protein K450DRAFT_227890 [Umbelopsis ramanniana AG]
MFPKFMPHREVLPLLESKALYKGSLRINRRNRQDAYVTCDDLEYDIYIHGAINRNRALEGDIVAVQLKDVEEVWAVKKAKDEKDADKKKDQPNPFAPKDEREIEIIPNENESCTNDEDDEERKKPKYCGIVVAILDRSQEPMLTGTISLNRPGQVESAPKKKKKDDEEERPRPKPSMFWIKPTDKRLPFVAIGIRHAPKGFIDDDSTFSKKLFVARITQWPITEKHPFGELVQELGNVGDLAAEAKALLAENCINDQDFPNAALGCLPATPWHIPAVEFTKRRDLRFHRIFSIDPETAKDLDDAVHVIDKGDGQYEVGVHIADVSFFIKSRSALDTEARSRGTSTYLVDRVIPMLPSLLCEQLCSLNPGVERLAFSVIWQMDEFGNIQDTWFGRTIIRSCGKLAYQHAQDVIEGRPLSSSLRIHGHTAEEVEKDILNLFSISKHLRKARFDNGALSMNSVKLYFDLDDEGKPIDCHLYEQKDANRLIEEFMLCANISVAKKIASKYPDEALLRRHAPPIERRLEEFLMQAENLGYVLDGSSAGALQASFNEIESQEVKETLLILAIKPMQRAKYFCTGLLDISKYVHYALNVPMYTHFTSPIRRYADVIVHRQLEAALNDVEKFPLDSKEIARIAQQCNIKKDGAKNAQDASIQLYLAEYIHRQTQLHGPMYCEATVVAVLDSAYEIFVPEYGIEKRLHLDRMALKKSTYDLPNHTLILTWQTDAIEMNDTQPEKSVLRFDDDDCGDEDDLVKAVESKLSMDEDKTTSETTSEMTTESDTALPQGGPVDSAKPNDKRSTDSTADSSPSSDGIQVIKVFEKIKVRLDVDMNKTPPMVNVHSVNPHILM